MVHRVRYVHDPYVIHSVWYRNGSPPYIRSPLPFAICLLMSGCSYIWKFNPFYLVLWPLYIKLNPPRLFRFFTMTSISYPCLGSPLLLLSPKVCVTCRTLSRTLVFLEPYKILDFLPVTQMSCQSVLSSPCSGPTSSHPWCSPTVFGVCVGVYVHFVGKLFNGKSGRAV